MSRPPLKTLIGKAFSRRWIKRTKGAALDQRHTESDSSVGITQVDTRKPLGPAEVAEIVGGTWASEPDPSWVLNRIQRMKVVGRSPNRGRVEPGTLAYARNPARFAKRFEKIVQGSSDVILMVGEEAPEFSASCPVLRVVDAVDAANDVARAHRDDFGGPVIAVTGSMGKTTVTSMISTVLSQDHGVFSSRSDQNSISHIRARTLAMADEDVAVFEVPRAALPGAEHVLNPDVAIVTAIAEAHMEAFGSLENTAITKSQLIKGLKRDGTAIINLDTPHSDLLISAAKEQCARVITYGMDSQADIFLSDYVPKTQQVIAEFNGSKYQYQVGASGKHNAINSLAVLGVLAALGLEVTEYLESFLRFKAVQGRGETSQVNFSGASVTLVDQTFNANPASMRAAIEDFVEQYETERVLILGDMLELGADEKDLHRQLVPTIIDADPTRVYLVGSLMSEVWNGLPEKIRGAYTTSPEDLVETLRRDITEDTAVLLKASHGTGLQRLVDALRRTE
jgi:UDP-N-acetylmuramoyl-tripeptide--D-alanyl-D-alanine ligase